MRVRENGVRGVESVCLSRSLAGALALTLSLPLFLVRCRNPSARTGSLHTLHIGNNICQISTHIRTLSLSHTHHTHIHIHTHSLFVREKGRKGGGGGLDTHADPQVIDAWRPRVVGGADEFVSRIYRQSDIRLVSDKIGVYFGFQKKIT